MKPKLTVGQLLFECSQKDNAIYITPMVVVSVGRKFFKARPQNCDHEWANQEFWLEDWKLNSQQGNGGKLYADPQDFKDELEAYELVQVIRQKFQYGSPNISLSRLRTIRDLITNDQESNAKP